MQKTAAVILLLHQLHLPQVHGGAKANGVAWTQTKAAETAAW